MHFNQTTDILMQDGEVFCTSDCIADEVTKHLIIKLMEWKEVAQLESPQILLHKQHS